MVIRYCSACGAKTVKKVPKYDTVTRSVCSRCDKVFYNSPVCLVGCALLCRDRMLFIKRGIPPREGYWTHGATGFVEPNESLQQATVREVREEIGIELNPRDLELVGVGSLIRMNQIYAGYFVELEKELGAPSPEAVEVAWFSEEEVPWGDLAFKETEPFIRALYAWIKQGRRLDGLASLPVIMKEAVFDRIK